MAHLVIVAHITAEEGKADFVHAELHKLVAPTRQEAGCLQYSLHIDNQNPHHFMFFETWETRELWQDHMQSAHLAAFGDATEGAVKERVIYEMSYVG